MCGRTEQRGGLEVLPGRQGPGDTAVGRRGRAGAHAPHTASPPTGSSRWPR